MAEELLLLLLLLLPLLPPPLLVATPCLSGYFLANAIASCKCIPSSTIPATLACSAGVIWRLRRGAGGGVERRRLRLASRRRRSVCLIAIQPRRAERKSKEPWDSCSAGDGDGADDIADFTMVAKSALSCRRR